MRTLDEYSRVGAGGVVVHVRSTISRQFDHLRGEPSISAALQSNSTSDFRLPQLPQQSQEQVLALLIFSAETLMLGVLSRAGLQWL